MPHYTHILFDFFGTLVEYSASRTEQGYTRSHELLHRLGVALDYPDFLSTLSQTFGEFDRLSDHDDHEFSMTEVGNAFLTVTLGRTPSPSELAEFVTVYIGEWSAGVKYPPDVAECVHDLSRDYRLAVVTNTHQPDLVPGHLDAMGLSRYFELVVTSVEVGLRKPHPTIYATALEALRIDSTAAVFVGDTYLPDFAGPERAGITSYLIDPHHRSPVPDERRLNSIVELPARLRAG